MPRQPRGKRIGSEDGTFEVAAENTNGGGSSFTADPDFRRTFAARVHADEDSLADQAVTDPTATVRVDVDKLTSSSLLPARWSVSGHTYHLDIGPTRTPQELAHAEQPRGVAVDDAHPNGELRAPQARSFSSGSHRLDRVGWAEGSPPDPSAACGLGGRFCSDTRRLRSSEMPSCAVPGYEGRQV